MDLKRQDIIVLLKLVAMRGNPLSINGIASEIGLSPSQVHAAVHRLLALKLAYRDGLLVLPQIENLRELLQHGLPYLLVVEHGGMVRGIPTAHAAPPLNAQIMDNEPPPVWPDAQGEVRGLSFSPIHKSAPEAARNDPALYELLALTDAIRGGRAREKLLAIEELNRRLNAYPDNYE